MSDDCLTTEVLDLTSSCWDLETMSNHGDKTKVRSFPVAQRRRRIQVSFTCIIILVHEKSIRHWMKMMFRIYISRCVRLWSGCAAAHYQNSLSRRWAIAVHCACYQLSTFGLFVCLSLCLLIWLWHLGMLTCITQWWWRTKSLIFKNWIIYLVVLQSSIVKVGFLESIKFQSPGTLELSIF